MELRDVSLAGDTAWSDSMDSKAATCCICPKCGTRHEMKLRWTGRGTPRKFCGACKKVQLNSQFDNYYDLHMPAKRIS